MKRGKLDESRVVDKRDLEYIRAQEDPEKQEVIFCAVTTWRCADRLEVGDAAPALELTWLDREGTLSLGGSRTRPLVLFFGSYT